MLGQADIRLHLIGKMNFVIKSRLVQDQTWFLFVRRTSLLRILLLTTDCVNYLAFNWSEFVLKYSIWPNFLKKLNFLIFWRPSYQILSKVPLTSASIGILQRVPEAPQEKKNIYIYILNWLELAGMLNYTENIVKWVISLLRLYSMNKYY